MSMTHTLLLKRLDAQASDAAIAVALAAFRNHCGNDVASVAAYRGVAAADIHVYFELATVADWNDGDVRAFAAALPAEACSDGVPPLDRMQRMFVAEGASAADQGVFRYVVEMDPAEGWTDELFRWYDDEHMPGLAATPGCVHARRFLNHDRGPYSFACYDLISPEVIASDAWLAVRRTPWSDRVRPQFRNTRRTMFRMLHPS